MMIPNEKRNYSRMKVDCDMTFKLVDSDQVHSGRCSSLSGAGIAFISEQPVAIGKGMIISIQPDNRSIPTMTVFIETSRITPVSGGKNEIAGTIKSIKATDCSA